MKFYIATKLENHHAHNALRDALTGMGHEITYDWTSHGPVYRDGLERIREISVLELQGVVDSDFVVVLWPGGRGTHVEMGAALALGIPVVLISNVENHHAATTETCAFYHHPLVRRGRSASDVFDLIQKQPQPL